MSISSAVAPEHEVLLPHLCSYHDLLVSGYRAHIEPLEVYKYRLCLKADPSQTFSND